MRLSWIPAAVLAVLMFQVPGACQELYLSGPQETELVEGQTYTVAWSAGGAETVDISIRGTRTPLGTKPRGDYEISLARGISAAQGEYACILPWLDSIKSIISITGRDGAGKQVSRGQKDYAFRPAVLAQRLDDGIYVDLHQRTNQRLYVEADKVITKAYVCSSSMNYHWMPVNVHPKTPHDHAGVFQVLSKSPKMYSKMYQVDMPWALQYLSGHFIHATSPKLYRELGRPASHGCNRLTRDDAHELYTATPIGTRVEVVGPLPSGDHSP